MHQVEARVTEGDQVVGVDGEQFGEDRAEFRQSADAAVVAAVRAGGVAVVAEAGQRQQLVGEVELFRRRLTTGEIQLQPCGE
ncbi:Uncharacterised protein [Mycobacteroides abscessus subsp. abscessus]|nr:Uncharacterised protein [Mycobacteroides abscessus subsp. abscessus]